MIYNSTLQWLKPKTEEDILEYVVLYGEGVDNMVWKASITNTTKAILTGLELNVEKYTVILLFRTSNGKVYSGTTTFELPQQTGKESMKTSEPSVQLSHF